MQKDTINIIVTSLQGMRAPKSPFQLLLRLFVLRFVYCELWVRQGKYIRTLDEDIRSKHSSLSAAFNDCSRRACTEAIRRRCPYSEAYWERGAGRCRYSGGVMTEVSVRGSRIGTKHTNLTESYAHKTQSSLHLQGGEGSSSPAQYGGLVFDSTQRQSDALV
jgi:hypothetical protein